MLAHSCINMCVFEVITAEPLPLFFLLLLSSSRQLCMCVCVCVTHTGFPGDRYLSEGAFKCTLSTNSLKGLLFRLESALTLTEPSVFVLQLCFVEKQEQFLYVYTSILTLFCSDYFICVIPPLFSSWFMQADIRTLQGHKQDVQ